MAWAFWEPILLVSMIDGIVALGLYVTVSSGQWSMAHGAAMGIGAYFGAILTTNFHWTLPMALLASLALGGLFGAAVALATLRLRQLVQSLATMALGQTLSIVAYNVAYIGGAGGFSGMPLLTDIQVTLPCFLLTLYAVWTLDKSRFGLACRAVRDDPISAAANGVNVSLVRIQAFTIGTAIAGMGGALGVHYTLVVFPSDLGFTQSFLLLIYVLFGGSYTIWGPVVGSFLFTAIPEFLRFGLTFRYALFGLAIVLVMLWRPQGVLTRRSNVITTIRRFRNARPPRLGNVNRRVLTKTRSDRVQRDEETGLAGHYAGESTIGPPTDDEHHGDVKTDG